MAVVWCTDSGEKWGCQKGIDSFLLQMTVAFYANFSKKFWQL